MKTKNVFLTAVLLLSSVVQAFPEEKLEEKKISNTYQASCILKIAACPEILPPDSIRTIEYILKSSPVGIKTAREILDLQFSDNEPQPFSDMINLEPLSLKKISDSTSIITMKLDIWLPDSPVPAVEEFMYAIIEKLRLYLEKEYKQHFQRLELDMQAAAENTVNAETELRNRQRMLREISDSYNLDRKVILENIDGLRDQLDNIERNIQESDFMLKEFSRRIAEASDKIESALKEDVVLKELENILVFQDQRIEMLRSLVEAGSADTSEFMEAKEKLAHAKIDIAQRKEQLKESAGGEKIENLNQRIDDISMRKQQDMINLRAIREQLANAQDLLQRADEYEIVILKTDIAKRAYEDALWSESELKNRMSLMSLMPTTITIIGSE